MGKKARGSQLEKTMKIGGLTAKNRFCIQPMECCDSNEKGLFTESTIKRYFDYCRGGAGIVVMESVTMQYESRSTKHQLLLDVENQENRTAWKSFMTTIKEQFPDTVFLVQLNHSGEFSSEEFSRKVCVKPHLLFGGQTVDEAYIDRTISQYIKSAQFLHKIGCDGVDLKFCHGYLGSQILRPYNDRLWKYGGSWENRRRFAFDLCEGIRSAIPDRTFLIGAKISVYEGIQGGQGYSGASGNHLDLKETLDLCRGLENRGADYFIESLGNARISWNLMAPGPNRRDVFFLHLAACKWLKEAVRPETVIIGSGLSVLGEKRLLPIADYAVKSSMFDAAALGRQALADPYLPEKFFADKEEGINWCTCCNGCGTLLGRQKRTRCVRYQ